MPRLRVSFLFYDVNRWVLIMRGIDINTTVRDAALYGNFVKFGKLDASMICWGEAAFGELGLDSFHQDDAFGTTENYPRTTPKADRITSVSAGKGAVAAVRENGTGAFCQQNDMGEHRIIRKPKKLALKKANINLVSCGATQILMVSEKGDVFQRNLLETPAIRPLNLNKRQVIQISCGDSHAIALSKDGQVFTWGSNSNGQLGLGNRATSTETPQVLSSLSGMPLAQISAGGDHSFALSLSGTVFGWGKNNAGQLGLGDQADRYSPILVKSLMQKRTVSVSCGNEHTAILTKGGLVFTFGSGRYGQLGHNSNRDERRPRLVAELWGTGVTQIACGRHHTLAYVLSSQTIYSFGRGEQGQLGSGQPGNRNVPLPVILPSEFDSDCRIRTIFAGGNQSFCSYVKESKCHDKPLHSNQMILTIDDKLINKWISWCDSKQWKNLKWGITNTFSSVSSLNGSFLSQRDQSHYQTTPDNSGLDLSLARLAFEKLAKNEKVMTQIASVVQNKLLPSLSRAPAGVEGLRVYLILPELLRALETHLKRDLCVSFASTVLKLDTISLKILEGLWSKLPTPFFKSLVQMFHSVSAWYINQMRTEQTDHWDSAETTVKILQLLYEVNFSAGRKIEDSNFYINEMKIFIQSINRGITPNRFIKIAQFCEILQLLTLYPSIFDMETKQLIFQIDNIAGFITAPHLNPLQNNMCVNRRSLLTDTIQHLRHNGRNYLWPLMVKFEGEDGIDHGGVSQEFFTVIARDILSVEPKMLDLFEDSRLVWFMPEGHCDHDAFYLLGILCGMALYNICVVNLHFPLALFKKLLGHKPTLEDLKELSPVVARNLEEVLKEDDEVLELLYLDFTVKGQEIVPCGSEIPVTKWNRQQYVEAYVDFVFNKSVKQQFEQFFAGFSQGCPNEKWKMLLPEELMAVLSGNVNYVWEDLRKNAKYDAYEPSDANIQNFWTVFFELSEEQKKKFLAFMTGSDRLPVGGLSRMKMTIVNQNKPDPDYTYPEASTCYCMLYLPNYSSIHILREKFVHAISFYEVFGAA